MKRFLSSCACLRRVGFAVGMAASIVLGAAAGLDEYSECRPDRRG